MAKRAGSTVVEVKGSHAVYVSQPDAVAALIQEAAAGVRGGIAFQEPAAFSFQTLAGSQKFRERRFRKPDK
jgi:hypothetical protein